VIQDVRGTAFNTSRGALYNGLGGAVGAGSPVFPGIAANFHPPTASDNRSQLGKRPPALAGNASAAMNDALLDAAWPTSNCWPRRGFGRRRETLTMPGSLANSPARLPRTVKELSPTPIEARVGPSRNRDGPCRRRKLTT
jgi:hypothetical protein